MRKPIAAAMLVLLGGMLLGGTVFREQVAYAAQAVLQVKVVNTPDTPVPVQQQGTTDVNVTNGSLSVTPRAPATRGGQRVQVPVGPSVLLGSPVTASALVVQFRNSASEIIFFHEDQIAARFPGPGPLVLPLNRPIKFDELDCSGPDGASCDLGWAGNTN